MVEFGFAERLLVGQRLGPEPSVRRSWPVAVIARAAERLTGERRLADQTTLSFEMLKYQTEKMKRLELLGSGRKPAAK